MVPVQTTPFSATGEMSQNLSIELQPIVIALHGIRRYMLMRTPFKKVHLMHIIGKVRLGWLQQLQCCCTFAQCIWCPRPVSLPTKLLTITKSCTHLFIHKIINTSAQTILQKVYEGNWQVCSKENKAADRIIRKCCQLLPEAWHRLATLWNISLDWKYKMVIAGKNYI